MANNNTNEGQKFPYNNNVIEYQGGAFRTSSANTLGHFAYDEGMEVRHGGNHPSFKWLWERFESYAHRQILRIESPKTVYSVDSNGETANNEYNVAQQWIVLSASRENARKQYNSSSVTDTRHLTLRGYRKLSKHLDDLPHRIEGNQTVYYVYD